jgi:hypothetical protein
LHRAGHLTRQQLVHLQVKYLREAKQGSPHERSDMRESKQMKAPDVAALIRATPAAASLTH